MDDLITGTAAGVPFAARPPRSAEPTAAVLAWHLMDPPRTETAFAAALPLDDVDAWRIVLALPLSPHRLPAGSEDAVMQAGREDAVRRLKVPIVEGAVEELPEVLRALRLELDAEIADVVLVGGSDGSSVAAQVALASDGLGLAMRGLALLSPVARMKAVVDAVAGMFGFDYPWDAESLGIAARHDLVARAAELAAASHDILLVVGAEDDPDGIVSPARELSAALDSAGARARFELVDGMAHALAEEPGLEPAPQTAAAERVDAIVSEWYRGLRAV